MTKTARNRLFNVRLSDAEREMLECIAIYYGIVPSQVVRMLIKLKNDEIARERKVRALVAKPKAPSKALREAMQGKLLDPFPFLTEGEHGLNAEDDE